MKSNELRALGAHIAAKQDEALLDMQPHEPTRRHLGEFVAKRHASLAEPTRPWWQKRAWLPLAASAFAVVGLLGLANVLWPTLQFQVGSNGRTGVLRHWEEAPNYEPLPLLFSDGTRVDLNPSARARVVEVSRAGAHVVLESGRAHLDVVPNKRLPGERAWSIDAGPFLVEVKGTRFDLSWDPRTDEFALDLFEGAVTVRGCGRETALGIVAGQSVRASCAKQQWSVAPITTLVAAGGTEPAPATNLEADAEKEPPEPTSPASSSVEAVVPPTQPNPIVDDVKVRGVGNGTGVSAKSAKESARTTLDEDTPRATPAPNAVSWQTRAQEGKYAEAYALAQASGFVQECERVSAEDLLLLGNTARLGGSAANAVQAYQAVRRRFPGTASAAGAAFALGRSQVKTNPAEAERWFETYLREQPGGALSQAASDWLFELAVRSGNPDQQRARARRYLDRYPSGTHAEDARRLLQQLSPQP